MRSQVVRYPVGGHVHVRNAFAAGWNRGARDGLFWGFVVGAVVAAVLLAVVSLAAGLDLSRVVW